jgi:eukaryotic-like serine/threonine-protein kinase
LSKEHDEASAIGASDALEPTYSPSREGSTPMPGEPIALAPATPARGTAQPRLTSSGFWARAQSIPGSTTAHSPAAFVGRVLADRWEVGPRIGLGGMASVHQGIDHRLGRAVAIKILHPHVAENPDSRQRLAREARAIAHLKHENVIEVYDYSIDDPDCTWLITELIDGPSLRQSLDRLDKPMPEISVMITTEVVRALRAAHQTGIVHRDVKPDNILIGREGRPKLSDFGIAQVISEQRMTVTGNLVGSPSYMSPEQANGKRTDHRTDLFSTGILLYRLVTGTLPFRGDTALDTIRKVSVGQFVDPVDLEPGAAGPVAGIIRRALAPAIEDRYQSADEMLADLMSVLQDAGLSATSEELPKFFADPSGYQSALRPRLAKELEARGKALLDAGQEARAVDCFNRALSLGEGNQRTLDIVRELSKRRGKGRVKRLAFSLAAAVGGIALVAAALVVTDRAFRSEATTKMAMANEKPAIEANPRIERASGAIETKTEPKLEAKVEPKPEAPPSPIAAVTEAPERAGADAPTRDRPKRPGAAKRFAARDRDRDVERGRPKPAIIAAGAPPEDTVPGYDPPKVDTKMAGPSSEALPKLVYGTLHVGTNVWADVFVDGKKVGTTPEKNRYPLLPGPHRVRAIQNNCKSEEREFTILAGETNKMKLEVICRDAPPN